MNARSPILAALALAALAGGVRAQDQEPAQVDTTFVTEQGQVLRYKGTLPFSDKPGGEERFEDRRDDRVPLGYGWRSITDWKSGDPRPEPQIEPGHVVTEYVDLHYSPELRDYFGKNFAEYFDYVYHDIKDRLGWTVDKPLQVVAPKDLETYAKQYGFPWWIPCELVGDTLVVETIQAITARGIAIESMTRSYVEYLLRKKTGDRLPYWFIYGAGATLAGEGWILKGQVEVLKPEEWKLDIDQATMEKDLELFRDPQIAAKELAAAGSTEEERTLSRIAFWRAYKLMEDVLLKEGIGTFKTLVETMEADPKLSFEDAVQQVYGKSVDALLSEHAPW